MVKMLKSAALTLSDWLTTAFGGATQAEIDERRRRHDLYIEIRNNPRKFR